MTPPGRTGPGAGADEYGWSTGVARRSVPGIARSRHLRRYTQRSPGRRESDVVRPAARTRRRLRAAALRRSRPRRPAEISDGHDPEEGPVVHDGQVPDASAHDGER